MKLIKHTSSMLMVAAAFIALPGFAVTVSTVAELTNAVATASAGDMIVITTSLTPTASEFMLDNGSVKSFLNVTVANLTIMGENESSRKTWAQGSEPVIIDIGENGRFVNFNALNLTVKNITITRCKISSVYGCIANCPATGASATFTNCVFRQNLGSGVLSFWAHNKIHLDDCAYISNETKLCGYLRGCDIANNTSAASYVHKMYDCTFSGHNLGATKMIAFENGADAVVSNCVFTANKGTAGIFDLSTSAQLMKCKFVNNTNNLIRANLTEASDPVEISGCTFTSNVIANANNKWGAHSVDWLVWNMTNNFSSAAAAQSHFLVKDTSFNGSSYQTGRGMAEVFGVTATDCTFEAFSPCRWPPDYNTYAMSACNSRLECCEISGGDLGDCVVDRCTLHDTGSPAFACFRDCCRVTNSLVTNCQTYLFTARDVGDGGRHDAEFVNCTFAGNNARTYYSRCAVESANDLKFVNCLFNSNTNGNGVATDFSMFNGSTITVNCWLSKVSFDHCFYGKFMADGSMTAERFAAKTNGVDTLSLCANPKSVEDTCPEVPYWSLLPKSPLIGKGDPLDFTASDLDLAGKLRLRDGKIDPGCYQCWLNPAGFMLIVR